MRRSTRAVVKASTAASDQNFIAVPAKRKALSTQSNLSKRSKTARDSVHEKNKLSTPVQASSHSTKSASPDADPDRQEVPSWSKHATSSPYPDLARPTVQECHLAHDILERKHGEKVKENFAEDLSPSEYPYVLDALVVATLSQATSWSNAKRAMASMTTVYGSPFEYDAIMTGGVDKLAAALRPGGMHNRKSKMLTKILEQVKKRHAKWDLNHLFNAKDEEAVKELISYDGVGPKSAYCVLSICLQRNMFAVDTHIYRIAGLWGWRPTNATRELAQAHLVPNELKFVLH